jgi:predicted GNAT family N-acyltransferase
MIIVKQFDQDEVIQLVEYNSEAYEQCVALRYEVLRKPLGLTFTQDQLQAEHAYFHIAYFKARTIVAYLMLVPENAGKMKMKQVVVDHTLQGKGIGARLVTAAEEFSKAKHFTLMYCHARDTAVPFYKKLGYLVIGEMFLEVTIPHYQMHKALV